MTVPHHTSLAFSVQSVFVAYRADGFEITSRAKYQNTMRVFVVGAGGHAKVVLSILDACKIEVVGVLDDDPSKIGQYVLGHRVVGASDMLADLDGQAFIAIGDNRIRSEIAHTYPKFEWISVVHPTAFVHESVQIGVGTVVCAGAIIQPDTQIGVHAIVNTGASIDHDCIIGDYVHCGPGSRLAGNVVLEEGVFLGVGTSAIPGASVGAWSTAGAGAVILGSIPPFTTAYSVPARWK